jgi:hypothetical protein
MDEPDWFTSIIRDIRCEPLFLDQIASLGIDPGRLEKGLSGLDYSLGRRPEIFPQAPLTPFSRALLYIDNLPPLRVFFTYDAAQVRLICVEFTE